MSFIALRFVLVLAVPFSVFLLYPAFSDMPVTAIVIGSQLSPVSGLLAIRYALWMPT